MFKDFPSLHPLMVHFPIVLILLTVPFQAVVVWKNWDQIRWATLILMGLAFLSSLAVSTIFHALVAEDAPEAILNVFHQHEKFAQYTLWMSGFTLVLKSIGDSYKIRRRSYQLVVLSAAIVTSILLSIAGHHGAALVHIEGVGPKGNYLMAHDHTGGHNESTDHGMDSETQNESEHDSSDGHHDMDSPSKTENGDQGMDHDANETMNQDMAPNKSEGDAMKEMDHGDMKSTKNGTKEEMDHAKDMKDMKEMDHGNMESTKNGTKKEMDHTNDMKDKGMGDMIHTDKGNTHQMDMDSTKGMTMPGMIMPGMQMNNPMDTFKFKDNNPARKKSKSE